MNELDPLFTAMRDLNATKSDGFEGLVRDMFTEVTGMGFRLMKNGPQGGVDAVGDTPVNGLEVGIEGKHYAPATSLPLDQLKSKIRDAVDSFPTLDLWVLAATRPISGGDVKELEALGASAGIDVLVLDWDPAATEPPLLAVLCAMSPAAVRVRLQASKALTDALDFVRNHKLFESASKRLLNRLQSPLVGLAAAKKQMLEWLKSRMKEADASRLAFDSHAALLGTDSHRISRGEINARLDGWWTDHCTRVGALLGQEGVGKTWAALDWVLGRIDSDPGFPLAVVVPAKNVGGNDADEIIAAALYTTFQIRDQAFWKRRVVRWLSAEALRPTLLVIIDGLNQNWMYSNWSELVLAIAGADRKGKAAVLLTVRPDFFNFRLKRLQDLSTKPVEVSVEPFNDAELEQLLATYGLVMRELPKALLHLLRNPRACRQALRRRKELEESGDITPERVVYEDWRGRQPQALKALSEEEFRAFIAGLARRYKNNIEGSGVSRRQLLDELTMDSGDDFSRYEGVLSEIIDGGWVTSSGSAHQFKVLESKLPYVLGLALISELRDAKSEEQVRSNLDEALDAYEGSDFSVKILRCASTFAMMEEGTPEAVRRGLLTYWLAAQNFGQPDFESFWRCLGLIPETVLDIAERCWFDRSGRHSEHEVLVKAFANSFKWTSVEKACEARLTRWFEGFWLDPLEGEVLGQIPEDENARARRAQTQRRYEEWSANADVAIFGVEIREVEASGRAWGCYRAIEMMSWLPRVPLLRPITAWAITRGVMGQFRQKEMFAWLLRWNENDFQATEQALLLRAKELASLGEVGLEAARSLLELLSTPSAGATLTALGIAPMDLDAGDVLSPRPTDPQSVLPQNYLENIEASALDFAVSKPEASPLSFSNSAPATTRQVLSRWSPSLRVKLERDGVEGILEKLCSPSTEGSDIAVLAAAMPQSVMVMDLSQVQRWETAACRARDQGEEWNWDLQFVSFFEASSAAQVSLLDLSPKQAMPAYYANLLVRISAEAGREVKARLENSSSENELIFWLDYLDHTAKNAEDLDSVALETYLSHTSTGVRERVLRFGLETQSTRLADALAASGWSCPQAKSKEERAYGSMLLACTSNPISVDECKRRVHPEALGEFVEAFPDTAGYLELFAGHVRDELSYLATTRSGTFPRSLLNEHSGWDQLVERFGEQLAVWLSPFLEKKNRRMIFGGAERFPLIESIQAISKTRPELSAQLVEAMLEDESESVFHLGSIRDAALGVATEAGQRLRASVLADANTDDKLCAYASGLRRSNLEHKLLEQIESDLAMEMAGYVARGITLAGFLVPSEVNDRLWERINTSTGLGQWLAQVKTASYDRYVRAKACFHWFGLFLSASSEDDAFVYFELFLGTVDPRFIDSDVSWKRRSDWSYQKLVHWSLHVDAINAKTKALHDEWKKVFLCTKPPMSNQYPTRR